MADGLLYVYSDPGPVPEAEFNDWYDSEHIPARLGVPGIRAAARYRAADGLRPPWLALYDMVPGTFGSPEYKALYDAASDREKSIMPRLATLDRRVYDLISDDRPGSRPAAEGAAPTVMSVSMSVPEGSEDDLAAWYATEHIPMLLAVPGWRRVRRYRLTAGTGPQFLALHELDSQRVFEEDAYKAAVSTPWRNRIVAAAIDRERRVFALHRSWG
jgi:hypothetical protein